MGRLDSSAVSDAARLEVIRLEPDRRNIPDVDGARTPVNDLGILP